MMVVRIPEKVIRDLQTVDYITSCGKKFSSIKEREEQMKEVERLVNLVSDEVLTIVMSQARKQRRMLK